MKTLTASTILLARLIKESARFALNSIIANKLRTILTLLGITIGIFSIILVFSVLDGLERQVRNSIQSLGDDVVYIQKWPWTFEEDYPWWRFMNRPVPQIRELDAIQTRTFTVDAAAFLASTGTTIEYQNNSIENVALVGTSLDYDKVRLVDISEGRFISPTEFAAGRNVVVIGSQIAEAIFPDLDPIGKQVKFYGRNAEVVGVFKKEGTGSFGDSHDNWVLTPIAYLNQFVDVNTDRYNPQIMAKAKPGFTTGEMIDDLTGLMRAIRRLKPLAEDNFALNESSLLTKQTEGIFSAISLAGWIIGGFSILVGGFGIANIMFVSVRERTSIIGIQKALGAKKYFILLQFLFEAIVLSLIGGAVGLLIAFGATAAISGLANMDFNLTLGNILLGLNVSAIIGLVSGFVPAWTASRLDPVEAIRSTG
ncbi:MAG: ABC transporter permease [Bacteroides sp.]|jgi:putative ABC transport system permease protein|nr:ABC transporter permease [Bacteroides sp.]